MAERTKELKTMSASDLKELLLNSGLETGTKEVMIKALVKHETKLRAVAREQKDKIRAVVIKKKQELEEMTVAELGKLGAKGTRSKPERVQSVLIQWQENGGVDGALAEIAQDDRRKELKALDNIK